MRTIRLAAAAALIIGSAGSAAAQGTPSATVPQAADAGQSAQVDAAYTAACTAKVSKELCACVVSVANIHVNDIAERQVFYDYMMGEVEKAKAQRAMFPPEKSRVFNVALQKADTMLGEQCEKFREAPKDAGAPKGQ